MKPTLTLTPTSLRRDLGLFSPLGEMTELSPAERAERRRRFLDDLITPVPRPPRRAAHWGDGDTLPAGPSSAAERAWVGMQEQRQQGAALIRELLIADLTRPLLGDISPERAEAIFTRLLTQMLERHPELNFSPADLEAALEEVYDAETYKPSPGTPPNLSLQKTGQRAADAVQSVMTRKETHD